MVSDAAVLGLLCWPMTIAVTAVSFLAGQTDDMVS